MFTVSANSTQTFMWVTGLLDAAREGVAAKDLTAISKLFRESNVTNEYIEYTLLAVMASRVLNLLDAHRDPSSATLLGYLIAPVVMHRMPGVTREEVVKAVQLGAGNLYSEVPVDDTKRLALFATVASVLVSPDENPFEVTHRLLSSEWADIIKVQK